MEPKSYTEAINSSDKDKWKEALQAEYDQLIKEGTWKLVPRPKHRRPVGAKWVFKVKRHGDGFYERHKARLVAKGFTQKKRLDFKETFAPVTRLTSVCTLLMIARHFDFEVHQVDVIGAFLNEMLRSTWNSLFSLLWSKQSIHLISS